MPFTRAPDDGPPSTSGTGSNLLSLVRSLTQDATLLVRQEIALAKAEVRDGLNQATTGLAHLAFAAGLLLMGGLVLVAFLILLAGRLIGNYWLAALVIGSILTLAGVILSISGIRRLRSASVAPDAIDRLKDDAARVQAYLPGTTQDRSSDRPTSP